MPPRPPVSVALPVAGSSPTLPAAFACVARQDHPDIEILVVLNGADAPTTALARELCAADVRARIIELERPNLAAALNVALAEARHDLLARMDADDACPPHRLRLQADAMAASPELGAIGCAWELADPDGTVIATVRPPTDPADLRWRLLLGNVLAHGSMLLRRDAVRRAGAYEERLDRAQDLDLWLRLSRAAPIGALPDVLYTHVTRSPHDPARSTRDQADVVAPRLLEAWRSLPASTGAALERAVADAITRDRGPDHALASIESRLREEGPTRDALIAWLWTHWSTPPTHRAAHDAARRALLRETGARLRADGVHRVWLWGAGDHTRWLLANAAHLGLEIVGIVDDGLAGSDRHGFRVAAPDDDGPGACVLISSDWHEEAIWRSSAAPRARGVRVERLYADADASVERSASVSTCA